MFENQDELHELIDELAVAFEEAGGDKYVTSKLATYTEEEFEDALITLQNFGSYIRKSTGDKATVVLERVPKGCDIYRVCLMYVGHLPLEEQTIDGSGYSDE